MRKLAVFSGGFCVASLLFAIGLSPRAALLLGAGLVAAAAGAYFLRCKQARRIMILCSGMAVGFVWCTWDWQQNVAPLSVYEGKTAHISAEAADYSRTNAYGTSTVARIELGGRLYTAVLYGDAAVCPGDRIDGYAKLRQTGRFIGDDGLYYGARGISLQAALYPKARISAAGSVSLRHLPARFSHRLKEALLQAFPEQEAAFEIALLTGDTSVFSYSVSNQLSLVGIKHIVAVSGMHIAVLMGSLLVLSRRRRFAAMLGLPLVWFFAISVGMTASVVRAAIMQSILVLAPALRRENDPPTSILTALLLILIPNPRAILDVGLQLSFTSVTGILLFSQRIYRMVWNSRALLFARRRARFLHPVLKAVLAQVAASISVIPFTLPLCVLYFHMYSLVSPLSGALIVTVIPFCFSFGILTALLAMIWLPLGRLLAWPVCWLVRYCEDMTALLSRIPYASVDTANRYLLIFLAGVYGIAAYLLIGRKKCSLLIPACSVTGLFCICMILSSAEYGRAFFSLTMLDVGQGQCIYAESRGNTCVYDCGGSEGNAGETAARFLQSIGRSRLDFLAVSHYDEDHAGGVAQLLSRVRVDTVFLPYAAEDEDLQMEILAAAEAQECRVAFVSEDRNMTFGAGMVTLFAPMSEISSNDSSMAVYWCVENFDVLLTGDLSNGAEERLLARHGELQGIDVIAAGHHGAASSTGTALLSAAMPEVAIISVGARNAYGHPAHETLERLEEIGAVVYRTDQCGNITIRR